MRALPCRRNNGRPTWPRPAARDATLIRQLEALVASAELTDDGLTGMVGDAALGVFSALPGERIGPYRILKLIDRGGMGAVYLAERDDQYRQQVASKWSHRIAPATRKRSCGSAPNARSSLT